MTSDVRTRLSQVLLEKVADIGKILIPQNPCPHISASKSWERVRYFVDSPVKRRTEAQGVHRGEVDFTRKVPKHPLPREHVMENVRLIVNGHR